LHRCNRFYKKLVDLDAQGLATALLYAEAKLGELLAKIEFDKGGRPKKPVTPM